MFKEISKVIYHILKNYEDKDNNSFIYILDELGSNLIRLVIDLGSMYNNPYIALDEPNNELLNFANSKCDSNLYIFDDLLDDEMPYTNDYPRKIDIFDNDWEDYSYGDVIHTIYKDYNNIEELNFGFYGEISNTVYFNRDNNTNVKIIIEESKNNIGKFNFCIVYKDESNYIATSIIDQKENRKEQIFGMLKDIIYNIVLALKTFEFTILDIRKSFNDYKFVCNDDYFYKILSEYLDENNKKYKWVLDKNIADSNYKKLVQDLKSSVVNYVIKENEEDNIEIPSNNNFQLEKSVDNIISSLEEIQCFCGNKTTTLMVPQKIKNCFKTIVSYQYEIGKYYKINIGCTDILDKDRNVSMHFPVIMLLDENYNIIEENKINDNNVAKCYSEIINWLQEELENFGIPISMLMNGIISDNNSISDIINNSNKCNVIVLDKNTASNFSEISNLIDDIMNNINSNVNNKILNKNIKNKTISENKNNKVYVKFQNPLQYEEYIKEQLLQYLKCIKVQFCLNKEDLKLTSMLYKEFADMSAVEYYDYNNIFSDFIYNELFKYDSLLININYKDILLDSMCTLYDGNIVRLGRIFDKINCSMPKIKNWYKNGTMYDTSSKLNLNICSCIGCINIDLTGLYNYIFSKDNKQIFLDATRISDDRFTNRNIFEISSYIWSVISNVFYEEYIKDNNYRGENQLRENKYLEYSDGYSVGQLMDIFDELIKDGYLKKNDIYLILDMMNTIINDDTDKIIDINHTSDEDKESRYQTEIKLPDGYRFYTNSVEKYYFRLKPEIKTLKHDFDSNNNYFNEFSLKVLRSDYNKLSDFYRNLILIQNIKDNKKFEEDLLKVLKYCKYNLDNNKY